MKAPLVIPVFVSNLGCPHRCIFCDQRQFAEPAPPEAIPEIVRRYISFSSSSSHRRKIIAFYGGSFTGIDSTLFDRYLNVASALVKEGVADALKASTRPDMVSEEILDRLIDAGFEELELGVQSMDDRVLRASLRGHTSSDTIRALGLIKGSGLKVGVQIMPGLPGENRASFRHTVDVITGLKPDTARIYPTVVMAGTALEKLYLTGRYRPLSIDEAILRSLFAYIRLTGYGSKVLRMGIPQSDRLNIVAGPFHPAFGFLVRSRAYRIMVETLIERLGPGITVCVNPKRLSELLGLKGENIRELGFLYEAEPLLEQDSVSVRTKAENTCLYFKDIIDFLL
ncbi:MAG: radical SAM protein [Thermodesulfobacteriota bacterium]|nr:radical SAM protein [Thermodesulfobacteriota bacterium]